MMRSGSEVFLGVASRRFTGRSRVVRRRYAFTLSPTHRKPGGLPPSSTPSTHWMSDILGSSGWMSTICSSPNPDTGEQALEIAEVLIRSNAIDVVVIDSVAALVPRAEIEGEMGDSHVGLQARLIEPRRCGS